MQEKASKQRRNVSKISQSILSALPAAFVNYHSLERREIATGRSDGGSRLRAKDESLGEASLRLSGIRACQGAVEAPINEALAFSEWIRKWNWKSKEWSTKNEFDELGGRPWRWRRRI